MKGFHSYLTIFFAFSLMVLCVDNGVLNAQSVPLINTTALIARDNQPPTPPNMTGPHAGAPGFELTFIVNATDPDGDQVYLKLDWGDGNMTDWLGPVNSSENIITHHGWAENGNYIIRVQVKDSQGLEQNETLAFDLTIAPQLTLTNIKPGYVYLLNSFFYVGLFEVVGAVVLMAVDTGLILNFSVGPAVASVYVVATNFRTSQNTNCTDDNATDGFSMELPIASGLYQLGYLAYDAEGNIIDGNLLSFLLFIRFGTMAATGLHIPPAHARIFI